jgi:putative transcriptional regulator
MATKKSTTRRRTAGGSIIEGLRQAAAWVNGQNHDVQVTVVRVPEIDVRRMRTKMKLSQTQFALKFGFSRATLRNWEQGRSKPDTPTRVLLAVIASHPEAVEDVLKQAS